MNGKYLCALILITILVSDICDSDESDIGFSLGVVYIDGEKVYVPGVHVHYLRNVNDSFRLGAGFEVIFDEHSHYTLSAVAGYEFTENLKFNYAPGISLVKEEVGNKILFTHHIEILYSFDVKSFHVGPSITIGFEGSNVHYMLGVHLGF